MSLWHLVRRVSLPYARHHAGLTVLTALGVSLGVAVFVAVQLAADSLTTALRETIDRVAGKAQLQVTAGEVGFPEEALETVRGVRGVRAAAPIIEVVVRSEKASEGNILVLGVDLTGDRQLRDYEFEEDEEAIEDPLVFLAQPDSICLSADFALRNGLAIDDEVAFETALGPKAFTVRGLLTPKGFATAFGGNLAVMDVYAAQFVFNRGRRFDRIDVLLEPEIDLKQATGAIATALGAGYTVEPPFRRGAQMESLLDAFKASMNLSCWQALFIGIFLIFNVFAVAVTRRRYEIGVLRSLGAGPRLVRLTFLMEGALLGLLGSIGGVGIGLLLAKGATRFMRAVVESAYGISHVSPEVHWSAATVLLGAVLGVLSSLAATWFPARSASRVDPVEALARGAAQRFTFIESRWRRRAGWAAIAAAAVIRYVAGLSGTIEWTFLCIGSAGAAAVLLAPDLTRAASRLLRPVMSRLGRLEGRLAADSLLAAPRRTSATVAALMLSVAFGISQAGWATSFEASFSRWLESALNADFYVTATERFSSKPFHFPASYAQEMEAIAGVKHVETVRVVRQAFRGRQIFLTSLETGKFLSRSRLWIRQGDAEAIRDGLSSGRCVVASDNFAVRYGLGDGDSVTLDTPSGPVSFPICGVIVEYSSENGSLYVDRSVFLEHWKDPSVDYFDVMLLPGADPTLVKREIQERFAARGTRLFVFTGGEFRRSISRILDQFFGLSYVQFGIGLIVAVMGIVNSLLISVSERRREIGILKAVGALRGQVRRLITFEAIGVSLAGTGLGFLFGAYLLEIAVHLLGTSLGGWVLPYVYPFAIAGAALPALLVVAMAAAWYPARVALATTATEALAYE